VDSASKSAQEHYRKLDREKVAAMRMNREHQRKMWDEVGYPMALWEHRLKAFRHFWNGTING